MPARIMTVGKRNSANVPLSIANVPVSAPGTPAPLPPRRPRLTPWKFSFFGEVLDYDKNFFSLMSRPGKPPALKVITECTLYDIWVSLEQLGFWLSTSPIKRLNAPTQDGFEWIEPVYTLPPYSNSLVDCNILLHPVGGDPVPFFEDSLSFDLSRLSRFDLHFILAAAWD